MTAEPPRLTWSTREPDELARRLERVLRSPRQAGTIGAVPARLAVVAGDRDELDVASEPRVGREGQGGEIMLEVSVLAVGWATIELERWGGCEPLQDDVLLGARTGVPAILPPRVGAMLPVMLLEPSTEGRIAARLARHGEGPAVLYLAAADASCDPARTPGDRRTGNGPFGPSSLAVDLRHGPFLVTCPGPYPPPPRPRTIER